VQDALFETGFYWRVDLILTAFFASPSAPAITNSTMIFKKNQKPLNGTCAVDTLTGYAMSTHFTIECTGWYDEDGYVTKYEFMGIKINFKLLNEAHKEANLICENHVVLSNPPRKSKPVHPGV
jgi:hypothetical protein